MIRVLTMSAVALFALMLVVGEAVAQERSVLQEGFQSSGAAGGVTNTFLRELLAKPGSIYGRLWGKDILGKKAYVETGGGTLLTLLLSDTTTRADWTAIYIGTGDAANG